MVISIVVLIVTKILQDIWHNYNQYNAFTIKVISIVVLISMKIIRDTQRNDNQYNYIHQYGNQHSILNCDEDFTRHSA